MTVEVRLVTLSASADELGRKQADDAGLVPEIYLSLVLEAALRDRQATEQRFAEALAKLNGSK